MHYGISALKKCAPTLESPPLLMFVLASRLFILPLILSYFSVFNSFTTNPNQLHTSKVSRGGFRIILREKITFKGLISGQEFQICCKEFWGVRGVSNLRWSELLLVLWRSFYCRQRCLKVSESTQELVARAFAASEMGSPVQPTGSQRLRMKSSIVRFGKWIFFARSFYFERLASWKWCYNILATDFS